MTVTGWVISIESVSRPGSRVYMVGASGQRASHTAFVFPTPDAAIAYRAAYLNWANYQAVARAARDRVPVHPIRRLHESRDAGCAARVADPTGGRITGAPVEGGSLMKNRTYIVCRVLEGVCVDAHDQQSTPQRTIVAKSSHDAAAVWLCSVDVLPAGRHIAVRPITSSETDVFVTTSDGTLVPEAEYLAKIQRRGRPQRAPAPSEEEE